MAEEIIVEVFPCTYDEDLGGEWTVPAGSRVVLALGWGAKNQGLVKQFLQAQTTTISLDGAAPVDLSDSYSAIEPRPDEEDFVSGVRHDTGVTLSAGESLQVDGMVVGFSCCRQRSPRRVHTSAGFVPTRGTTHNPLPDYGLGVSLEPAPVPPAVRAAIWSG